MVSNSRYTEMISSFDQAAHSAFSAISPEVFVSKNPELSKAELFMVYGAYLQASRQACANAQAEFRVLAAAADLESKLAALEIIEAQQGLDEFGGLAEGASQQHAIVPDDVARHCRLASKRSEHCQIKNLLEQAELQLAAKKCETEQLMMQAEEVSKRYRQAESHLEGISQASLSWRACHNTADALAS